MEYCAQILGLPAHNGCGAVGESPDKGHEYQRAGTPFLRRKVEEVGHIQLREENTPGRVHYSLPVFEGNLQARVGLTFYMV